MKVLVTGAGGQVGCDLRRTVPPGHTLAALGREELDVSDAAAVVAALTSYAPDLVINAAAYTAVDRAESEPERAARVNSDGPRNLARACSECGAGLFHLSTDYVFDGTATRPYREDDPASPLGVYGRTKWHGEQAVRACLANHLILRVAWVNGVSGRNFVKTMLRLGRERTTLSVVADQHGAPTFARAIAAALWTLAERLATGPAFPCGTYHYCGTPATTWHGFAEEVVRQARAYEALPVERVEPITTAQYPTAAPRPANARLDCSRIKATFGLSPPDWRADLADMLAELYA